MAADLLNIWPLLTVQIHVNHDRVDNGDIITVQRSHPTRPDSYVFIVRTAFSPGEEHKPLPRH